MGVTGITMAIVASFIYFPFVTIVNEPYEYAGEFRENGYFVDPDLGKKPVDLIISRGFKVNIHKVETPDGYIITVYRIIHPFINQTRTPLVLQHGYQESSLCFLNGSPSGHVSDKYIGGNLGFELAKQGYDVWLPNFRGTRFSTEHKYLNFMKDREYWNFSLDHLSQFDLRSVIDYVRNVTKYEKIAYVGHSQGTTTMFQLLATFKEYNEIIEPFVALAPVVYITKIRMPLLAIGSRIPLVLDILRLYGGRLYPTDNLSNDIAYKKCGPNLIGLSNCAQKNLLKYSEHFRHFNSTRFPVIFSSRTLGVSSWQSAHYGQYIKTGRFARFDYGCKKNERIYGTKKPPLYNLAAVTNKNMMFIVGKNDQFTVLKEYYRLISELGTKPLVDHVIQADYFDHYSIIYGTNVAKYLIIPVLRFLDLYFPLENKPQVTFETLDESLNEIK